jgi:histidinol-phosphatase (PHP family)
MIIDLHNHTTRCNHAKGSQEEYVQKAIDMGIDIFGFSDHAPMKFDKKYRMSIDECDNYEHDTLELKDKYKKNINILLAYEVDYIDGYLEDRVLSADVDYLVGSVHFINKWGFDNPEFIAKYKSINIDKIWEDYFLAIKELAKTAKFQIVGHLDLIKVFKFLPKKDIRVLATKAIKELKKSNVAIEINSAGFKKPIAEQYPSQELLSLCFELGLDITFCSDAHSVDEIGVGYKNTLKLAKSIGFTHAVYFEKKEKIRVDI